MIQQRRVLGHVSRLAKQGWVPDKARLGVKARLHLLLGHASVCVCVEYVAAAVLVLPQQGSGHRPSLVQAPLVQQQHAIAGVGHWALIRCCQAVCIGVVVNRNSTQRNSTQPQFYSTAVVVSNGQLLMMQYTLKHVWSRVKHHHAPTTATHLRLHDGRPLLQGPPGLLHPPTHLVLLWLSTPAKSTETRQCSLQGPLRSRRARPKPKMCPRRCLRARCVHDAARCVTETQRPPP